MEIWGAVLVGVAALVLSALGGWPLTAGVLRLAARSADAGSPRDGDEPGRHVDVARGEDEGEDLAEPDDGPTGRTARDALRGGTWIGLLERLAITGCLLAGYPSGIALVIAVKGLGRYPELRENPATSERFVIGTLASMLWAATVGGVAAWVVGV